MAQLTRPIFAIISATVAISSAQVNKGDPRRIKITPSQATVNARRFLVKVFGPDLSDSALSVSLMNLKRAQPWFTIVDKERGLKVHISAVDGHVKAFYNSRRSYQQFRRINRTGKIKYSTDVEWRQHLVALGQKLGIPAASVANFKWKREGERKDANAAGLISCRLYSSDGRRLARISVDPQDGTLYHFMDDRDLRPQ